MGQRAVYIGPIMEIPIQTINYFDGVSINKQLRPNALGELMWPGYSLAKEMLFLLPFYGFIVVYLFIYHLCFK